MYVCVVDITRQSNFLILFPRMSVNVRSYQAVCMHVNGTILPNVIYTRLKGIDPDDPHCGLDPVTCMITWVD